MTSSAAAVLLHPVRLRIVLAMGDEQLTTAEIAQHLPDVAQATLYRQVAVLADADERLRSELGVVVLAPPKTVFFDDMHAFPPRRASTSGTEVPRGGGR